MSILLAALLFTVPANDVTPPSAPATDEGTPAPKPKKPKKICHEVPRSGSHIAQTVCRTQAEWDNQPTPQDMGMGVDIPGNRATTGRSTNVGTKGRGL